MLRTNTQLHPQEAMMRYRNLAAVERAFALAKAEMRTRPIFCRTDAAIGGHDFCTFLALVLRKGLADRMTADRRRPAGVELHRPHRATRQPDPQHRGGAERPPGDLHHAVAPNAAASRDPRTPRGKPQRVQNEPTLIAIKPRENFAHARPSRKNFGLAACRICSIIPQRSSGRCEKTALHRHIATSSPAGAQYCCVAQLNPTGC